MVETGAVVGDALLAPWTALTNSMRRGYSYKRFSSPKQSRGDSMRRQTQFEAEIVKELDLFLDDTFNLSDTGVSAYRSKNAATGALADFLKLVEAGRIPSGSVLIVENIDRLTRDKLSVAQELITKILKSGVDIATAVPRRVYTSASADDLLSLFELLLGMVRAHEESMMKSVRVAQAWRNKRKRAAETGLPMTQTCPAWLRLVGEAYEVIPDRAAAIRDIFAWTRDGLGVLRVVRRLVERNVPSFGRKEGWNTAYVRLILNSPAVYGEFQPGVRIDGRRTPDGPTLLGYYPAVVTKDEYFLVRATIKGRKRTTGRPSHGELNLLTGLVWHAVDRVKMSMLATGRTGKKITYLQSTLFSKGADGRGGRSFPYSKLEACVLESLKELRPEDVSDRLHEQEKVVGAEVARLEKALFVADQSLREMKDEKAKLVREGSHRKTYIQSLGELIGTVSDDRDETERRLLELKEEAMKCGAESLDEAKSVIALMRDTPDGPEREELRRVVMTRLRWLVTSIWVHIEKVNHVRQYAHVQMFLRNGIKRTRVVSSFDPAPGKPVIPCARTYDDVDFRTYAPSGEERSIGSGNIGDLLRSRGGAT